MCELNIDEALITQEVQKMQIEHESMEVNGAKMLLAERINRL